MNKFKKVMAAVLAIATMSTSMLVLAPVNASAAEAPEASGAGKALVSTKNNIHWWNDVGTAAVTSSASVSWKNGKKITKTAYSCAFVSPSRDYGAPKDLWSGKVYWGDTYTLSGEDDFRPARKMSFWVGDIDNDRKVTTNDLVHFKNIVENPSDLSNLMNNVDGCFAVLYDVNWDGKVNRADYNCLLNWFNGKTSQKQIGYAGRKAYLCVQEHFANKTAYNKAKAARKKFREYKEMEGKYVPNGYRYFFIVKNEQKQYGRNYCPQYYLDRNDKSKSMGMNKWLRANPEFKVK